MGIGECLKTHGLCGRASSNAVEIVVAFSSKFIILMFDFTAIVYQKTKKG